MFISQQHLKLSLKISFPELAVSLKLFEAQPGSTIKGSSVPGDWQTPKDTTLGLSPTWEVLPAYSYQGLKNHCANILTGSTAYSYKTSTVWSHANDWNFLQQFPNTVIRKYTLVIAINKPGLLGMDFHSHLFNVPSSYSVLPPTSASLLELCPSSEGYLSFLTYSHFRPN